MLLRQAGYYLRDTVAGYITPAAPAEYSYHSSLADIRRRSAHDSRYLWVAVRGESLTTVITAGGVIAKFPEDNFRLECGDPRRKLGFQPGEIFLVGYRVRYCDVHLRAVVLVLAAKTDVENVLVVSKYVSGAVAVMGVGVQDGESSRPELVSQIRYSQRCAVEMAASAEIVSAGMVVAASGENEGGIYLPAPDPLRSLDRATS